MPLIVENGTGLTDADAYVTVAEFKDYCDKRGLAYGAATDGEIEQKVRLGTDYVDTINRYKGSRRRPEQSLQFPRANLYDWGGEEVIGLPLKVKQACAELAFRALSGELYEDLDRGGMVQSESVGEISVTYAEGAPRGRWFTAAMAMLAQYVRDEKSVRPSPRYGTSAEGYFEFNMMANPSPASDLAP